MDCVFKSIVERSDKLVAVVTTVVSRRLYTDEPRQMNEFRATSSGGYFDLKTRRAALSIIPQLSKF